MFDLETFGTQPGSVIRSIGAVYFDPQGAEAPRHLTFYANIDRKSCEDAGLTVDPETEAWWAKQSPEAQKALLQNCRPLAEVAREFHDWFNRHIGWQIWCQGANFDAVLWEAAVRAVGLSAPWKFYNVRDTRTVYEAFGFDTKSVQRIGTYHNALDDARHQAVCVQKAFRRDRRKVEDLV